MARKKNPTKPIGPLVVKSNFLVRSKWKIDSVWEPRLVAILASKIRMEDTDFCIYKIPLVEVLGTNYSGQILKDFSEVVKGTMSKPLTIQESSTRVSYYNLFSKCTLDAGAGVIELRFDPDLKLHLIQLHERFTQYGLAEFISLPSIYSQRMYEILKSWNDGRFHIEISISELCDMLDAPEAYQRDFGIFRRKVLEQAHKDIVVREMSTLWFDWEPIRAGRGGKVVAVRFLFSKSKAQEMTKNQAPLDELFVHQELQRKSNTCFERLAKRGQSCTPNFKSEKCRFCTSRGRMYGKLRQRELNLEGNIPG